jgi:hypothetical protein
VAYCALAEPPLVTSPVHGALRPGREIGFVCTTGSTDTMYPLPVLNHRLPGENWLCLMPTTEVGVTRPGEWPREEGASHESPQRP